MTDRDPNGIPIRHFVPRGYRGLDRLITNSTAKAVQCGFDGIVDWLPRRAVILVDGQYWAAEWAIKLAHGSHKTNMEEREMNTR